MRARVLVPRGRGRARFRVARPRLPENGESLHAPGRLNGRRWYTVAAIISRSPRRAGESLTWLQGCEMVAAAVF